MMIHVPIHKVAGKLDGYETRRVRKPAMTNRRGGYVPEPTGLHKKTATNAL